MTKVFQIEKWSCRGAPIIGVVLLLIGVTSATGAYRSAPELEFSQGEGVEPTASISTEQTLFDFRSGFWLNLHHFLYLQAILVTPDGRKGTAETAAWDATLVPQFSAEQKAKWDGAVQFYAQYGKRDALRDSELIRANYELSDAGNSVSLAGRKLPAGMQATLEEVAPVYRALWWPEHDRKNREWAAAASKLIRRYGEGVARRLANAYQTDWPKDPATTEVVIYANWAGAYTTTHSTLITISSADPAGQGYASFENLFHEASHALVDNFQKQLDSRLTSIGKKPTFQMTHAIIFYTSGAITLEALAANNIHDYIPYAIKNGQYDRIGEWKHYQEVCERDWLQFLDGKTSFDAALTAMAKDI